MARPGVEPRTFDLRVRCPTDCATLSGYLVSKCYMNKYCLNQNIYILGVLTEKPYSKSFDRNEVYIPIKASSHATSMTSK